MRHQAIDELVDEHIPKRAYAEQWKTDELQERAQALLGQPFPIKDWASEEGVDDDDIRQRLYAETDRLYAEKEAKAGPETMRNVEKQLLLQVLDKHWREHLVMLDHLRSVIHLRGYAQRDPLNEYKSEAFQLFEGLLGQLRVEVTRQLGHIRILTEEEQAERKRAMAEFETRMRQQLEAQARAAAEAKAIGAAAMAGPIPAAPAPGARVQPMTAGGQPGVHAGDQQVAELDPADQESWGKVGRNAPCPCGSGKKYKHCHGRTAAA
jgi:preprotein translocase subunit SecA